MTIRCLPQATQAKGPRHQHDSKQAGRRCFGRYWSGGTREAKAVTIPGTPEGFCQGTFALLFLTSISMQRWIA